MMVLTCNIRCYGGADGENGWAYRKEMCADVIRSRSPDIVCFQEMWIQQYEDLSRAFPEFESFGVVDEPLGKHPMNSIFYRADAFARLSAGGYWLSETPHVTGSKSWDSDCIRLANWVRLLHKACGKEFRVVNTHLDHIGQTAREQQAGLIVEDAQAYPQDYLQILTGDMNCGAANPAIGMFKAGGWRDTYGIVHGTENPGPTYHGFLGPSFPAVIDKIDWIFFKGENEVLGAEVIRDSRDGRFPSDHYFVSAEIELT